MEEYEEAVQSVVEHLNGAIGAIGRMTEITNQPIGSDMMIVQRIIMARDEFKKHYGFID